MEERKRSAEVYEDDLPARQSDAVTVKQIKYMVLCLGILLILSALIWCYNLYKVKNIEYVGLTRYTEAEFEEKVIDSFFLRWTPYFCISDFMSQKKIPFVEKYEIDYVDKQTVRITVHEKRVVGCVTLMGMYMYFDKDGIVVESTTKRLETIPVITGLEFDEIILYEKLKIQKARLFQTILNLAKLIEENELNIQEINFDTDNEVTLTAGTIKVELGHREMYDEQLKALKGILKAAEGRKGMLDMRNYSKDTPEVVLKE